MDNVKNEEYREVSDETKSLVNEMMASIVDQMVESRKEDLRSTITWLEGYISGTARNDDRLFQLGVNTISLMKEYLHKD